MNETGFELYNNQTEKLDDEYNELSDVEKKISKKNIMVKVSFFSDYDYMISLHH